MLLAPSTRIREVFLAKTTLRISYAAVLRVVSPARHRHYPHSAKTTAASFNPASMRSRSPLRPAAPLSPATSPNPQDSRGTLLNLLHSVEQTDPLTRPRWKMGEAETGKRHLLLFQHFGERGCRVEVRPRGRALPQGDPRAH